MNLRYSKVVSMLLILAMLCSTLGSTLVFAAPNYYEKLEATNASVTLDGTNPSTVTVSLVGTSDMDVYAIQGVWDTAEAEGTGKLKLTDIASSLMTFTGMNYADAPTGKVLWRDGTFSIPAVLADGTEFMTATYTVAADAPAGTYTVSFCTEVITADYNSYTTVTYYTAKITVTRPAAHVCSGAFVKGQSATCTVNGWKDYYSCSCGKFYTEQACTNEIADLAAWKIGAGKIPAGHKYGTRVDEDKGTHKADQLVDGMKAHYFCDVCDTYFTEAKVATTKEELVIKNVHSYTTQYGYKANDGHADTCSCGAKNTVVPHTPGAPATETTDQICTVCEYVITPKTEHIHKNNLTFVAKTPASCTVNGNEAYYECSCGKYFEDDQAATEIADLAAWKIGAGKIAAGHTYGTRIDENKGTHTATTLIDGMKAHYFCDVCDTYFTEAKVATTKEELVIKNVHSYTTQYGYKANDGHADTCSCGAKNTVVPHTPGAPATETTDQICTVCEYVITPKTEHIHKNNLTFVAKTPASCTVNGNEAYYECSCGKYFEDDQAATEIADLAAWKIGAGKIAAGHTYGTRIDENKGTHTATTLIDGMKAHYFCDVCDTYFTEAKVATTKEELVIKNVHSYTTQYGYKANDGHADTCSCGAKNTVVPHTPGAPATETTDQICTVCEYVITPKTEHIHKNNLTFVAKTPASCTVNGNEAYYECSCGKYFEDDQAATEIADLAAWKIGAGKIAAGHTYGTRIDENKGTHTATTLIDGMKAHYFCDVCDTYFTEAKVATTKEELVIKNVHSYTVQNGFKDETYHANTCQCGAVDTNKQPHVPGAPATETTDQICTVCKKVLADALGHQHKFHLNPVSASTPDCVNPGHKAYWQCDCAEAPCFEDADATVVIADIVAWKAEGGRGYIKANGHSFNTKVSDQLATAATCAAPATYYVQCDNCFEVTADKALAKDDVKDSTNHTSTKVTYKNITATTHDEYYECCDALKAASVAHTYNATTYTCACGAEKHTHAKYESDKTGHWSVCSCGEVHGAVEDHDNDGELCEVCGYVYHTCGGKELTSYKKPADDCDATNSNKYYICSCGKIYSDINGKNEVTFTYHISIPVPGVDPTCDKPGYTTGLKCINCEQMILASVYVPATGHDWSDWVVTEPAEEGKNGVETKLCKTCSKTETRSIPALDHSHTLVAVAAKTPTCTEFGNIAYWYCTGCDWMEAEGGVATNAQAVKLAPAHSLVAVEAKAATCEEFGNIAYWYCENCDWVEVEGGVASNRQAVKLAPAHSLVAVEAKAATCEEFGNIAYWYCENCDWVEVEGGVASNRQAVKLAPAHSLVAVEAKAATCEEFGNIAYWYCENCDWVEVEGGVASNRQAVKLAPAHTLVAVEAKAATCTEAGNIAYWYCENCDWMEAEGGVATNRLAVILVVDHELVAVEAKAATCTENGNIAYWYCANCDWVEVEGGVASNRLAVQTPAAHALVAVEAKAATCTENGNIAYWYCANCDWVEVEGGVASNRLAVQTPAAHALVAVEAKASTCFELGNIAYWYCSNCDWMEAEGGVATNAQAVKLPLAHVVEHVEAKAPTATENGNIEYWYCKDCGYAWLDAACTKNTNLKAVILPATGETTDPVVPETGDNALFIAAVSVIAVATLGVVAVKSKKRED